MGTIRLIIFGGTGNLSRKKLVPALYRLWQLGKLPRDLKVIGIGSRALSNQEYIQLLMEDVDSGREEISNDFFSRVTYERCDLNDCKETVAAFFDQKGIVNILYLALPAKLKKIVLNQISNRKGSDDRVVVEKPFGQDQESAKELNLLLAMVFNENQIYRMDHYLAKETVQNIFAFRFSNGLFEPMWNNNFIESVRIDAFETNGVGERARYFDGIGIVKDMIQSHLLQLMAIVAMDVPKNFSVQEIRDQKVAIFKSVKQDIENIKDYYLKAQYENYKEDVGLAQVSDTPTYVAMKLFLKDERWAGVPFYLRTGKKMKNSYVRIDINFKPTPINLFGLQDDCCGLQNRIRFIIQPEEMICIRFGAKKPGGDMMLQPVNMSFSYKDAFHGVSLPAYARLLEDLFKGDQSLFAREDGVESSWAIIDKYEELWEKDNGYLQYYTPGSSPMDLYSINKYKGLSCKKCKECL
jgi:glucose-6-phosphate 1-dehydrogenase